MGRGLFFSKSSSQLASHQQQVISTPTLVATDAQPRADLHTLREVSSTFPSTPQTSTNERKDTDRPKTAGGNGRARSASRADPRVARPAAPSIDQQLSKIQGPGLTPSYNKKVSGDEEMIGMALGSPGHTPDWATQHHPESRGTESQGQAISTRAPDPWNPYRSHASDPFLKPRSQKWKKFGGFFGGRRKEEARGSEAVDVHEINLTNSAQSLLDGPPHHDLNTTQDSAHRRPSQGLRIDIEPPKDPPPYSASAIPIHASTLVDLGQRHTPSPIEEVEQEIDKMIAHNSWNADNSPTSPVSSVDEIHVFNGIMDPDEMRSASPGPLQPRKSPLAANVPSLERQGAVDVLKEIAVGPVESTEPEMYLPVLPEDTEEEAEDFLFTLDRPASPIAESKFEAPKLNFSSSPLLDIEIPSIQMERYSIMFGNFLQPEGKSDRSSLLAPRNVDKQQEKLRTLPDIEEALREEKSPELVVSMEEVVKLEDMARHREDVSRGVDINIPEGMVLDVPEKTYDEPDSPTIQPQEGLLEVKPSRRATSPSPARSPSFSLFPSAPRATKHGPNSNHYSPGKPRMLQRSRTAPSAISPNRATFEGSRKPAEERGRAQGSNKVAVHSMTDKVWKHPSGALVENALQLSSTTPSKGSSKSWPRLSEASVKTVNEEHGEELILGQNPLMPLVEQVEEPEASRKKALPPRPSAMAANDLVESIRKRVADEPPPPIITIPQISIARQMSVGQGGLLVRRGTKIDKSKLDSKEHLIERQPNTPTLVVPPQNGHRPKRSEDVIIEGI